MVGGKDSSWQKEKMESGFVSGMDGKGTLGAGE